MSRPISKEWISMFRGGNEYIEGVKFFVNFAKEHAPPGITTCICPCKKCNLGKRFPFETVKKHLILKGMLPTYNEWFLHGEKPYMNMTEHPTIQIVEEEKIQEGNIEDDEGENYKNDLWNSSVKEFEMNLEPHVARPLVEGNFSQFFRSEKHRFRVEIIRKATDKCDAIQKCPDDVDKVWWATFVENEWDEKKMQQCKKNAENRSKNTINHSLGRRSYNQVYESMEKENPGANIKRATVWKAAHKRKNGEVLLSAQEKFKQIEEVKRKTASGQGSTTSIDDFEHDKVAAVFGLKKKNRCRAMSSSSSVKQVKYGQAVKALAKQKVVANLDEWQAKMEATIKATVKESMKELAAMYFGVKHSPPPHLDTSRTEGSSNSLQNQIFPQDLNNALDEALSTPMPPRNGVATSQSGKQYVMLLSREEKEVAKGYIFNHNGQCHTRVVARDERVVWVTKVKDPEAPMYEAPQNGLYKLCEISDGGFLIWLQSRLRYL